MLKFTEYLNKADLRVFKKVFLFRVELYIRNISQNGRTLHVSQKPTV